MDSHRRRHVPPSLVSSPPPPRPRPPWVNGVRLQRTRRVCARPPQQRRPANQPDGAHACAHVEPWTRDHHGGMVAATATATTGTI